MILLNPGPVTLSQSVRNALNGDDLCHREPEFAAMTKRICQKLEAVYLTTQTEYKSVLLTTSGSGAVEAMLSTFSPSDGKTLVLCNGVYGERMVTMLQRQSKPVEALMNEWCSPLCPLKLEERLALGDITHVAVVHHETTTGRLNELSAIAAICLRYGAKLMIDAVSSFGAEWIDFDSWQPLAVAATANKCLHSIPGVAFVIARELALQQQKSAATTLYLDLQLYYREQRQGWSPFTQAVQGFMALEAALDEFHQLGGWQARRESYQRRGEMISSHLATHNIQPLLNLTESSCVLRTYVLSDTIEYHILHDELKKAGFTIYAGQGQLGGKVFRVAVMGAISDFEIQHLLMLFDKVMGC